MTSILGAVWFCAHIPPTDKLLHNLAALDGANLLCISSLSLFMAGLLPFVPMPALAISLNSSPWDWIYSSQCAVGSKQLLAAFIS